MHGADQGAGMLGIEVYPLPGEVADELGLRRGRGLVVTEIERGGPAEKAGLKAGDILLAVGETKLTDYNSLLAQIRQRKPGDKMKLTLTRKGEQKNLEVTLQERTSGSSTRPYGCSVKY